MKRKAEDVEKSIKRKMINKAEENGVNGVVQPEPTYIHPSKKEIAQGKLSNKNLETAIRALFEDGIVIINDVYDHDDLDFINEEMLRDSEKLAKMGEDAPKNFHRGNFTLAPPPQREYFKPNIFLNPIVSQVTSTALGPKPKWNFSSSNVALPVGKEFCEGQKIEPHSQPTHSDAYFDHPCHPFCFIINTPLIAMDKHNGATEFYLGTHNYGRAFDFMLPASRLNSESGVKKPLLEERKQMGMGPIQPACRKGATMIRDLRIWHGGKPNFSDEIRVVLSQRIFSFKPDCEMC